MSLTVTLSSLRTQAKRRADMENSKFLSDSEWNDNINSSWSELYDMLVAKGVDWFVLSQSFVIDGSNSDGLYALPESVYKLVGIDYMLGGQAYPMQKFIFADRHKYRYNSQVIRYRIVGSKLQFKPNPPAQTVTLWYVPPITPLSADGDTIDGVNGWEDYIITDAAIKALTKEESDATALMVERQGIVERIETMAVSRDDAFPERVSDVTGLNYPDAYWLGDR